MRQAGESPATSRNNRLPGAGGRHRTGPKEDAARANAAGGRKRPAARDGGDATEEKPIASGSRGAAGPARPSLVGVQHDVDCACADMVVALWKAKRGKFFDGALLLRRAQAQLVRAELDLIARAGGGLP